MNIFTSHKTLSRYVDDMPNPSELSHIFLEHICEVEDTEEKNGDTIFELKITPDRGHLLSYMGLAREIAIFSDAKLKAFSPKVSVSEIKTNVIVDVREPKACLRYVGRVVEGVDGREAPAWLREALEAVGQRSINAIVDVTNFVMLELGQPMHAFDADKLSREENGDIKIVVRSSEAEEKIETLDGKDIVLPPNTLIIADGARALAIAGVKGGAHAGVGEKVNTIVLEAATFDSALVRKASAGVNICTDSSRRFEHNRAPEIAPISIERATELLLEIFTDAKAGEIVDVYPRPANPYHVSMSSNDIARTLGIPCSSGDLSCDLERLGFEYKKITRPREVIVSRAKELVGTPYFYGASVRFDAPAKFDCSGFSAYLYLEAGIKIPRISVDQYVFGQEVSIDALEAGDLIFSVNEGSQIYHESIEWMKGTKVPKQGIDHVGVYVGDGMIAHASRYNKSVGEDGGVLIEKLAESPRFKNITGARRMPGVKEERFSVTAPAERFDIRIPADIVEEVARIIGYDKIPVATLSVDGFKPVHNDVYGAMLRVRNTLASLGFSEIFTYAFRKEGKVELINPMAEGVNFLRDNLTDGMKEALVFNARNAPLLGVDEILIFEIGTVFFAPEKEEIHISLGVTVARTMKQAKKEEREKEVLNQSRTALERNLGVKPLWVEKGDVWECQLPVCKTANEKYEPLISSSADAPYKRISAYPFVLRDIAMWAQNVTQDEIIKIIREEGTELLVRDRLFDVFTKDAKISYAFNLVFQSSDRTLSDAEISEVMARITEKLTANGLEVR
ncbi:MAG: C40 family peptidase [Candidatus Yonathbacteria bacterium]|nr:C40 family peptidase [Candidatus Yonathbacteria bacterium]